MPQAYSNPARENDPHALPDVEYFHMTEADMRADGPDSLWFDAGTLDLAYEPGWYWWSCFPGCLPDGDPIGPFATEAECVADFTDDESEAK
jgi:hypothetical protein